jgi:hypothetical protein
MNRMHYVNVTCVSELHISVYVCYSNINELRSGFLLFAIKQAIEVI